MWPLNQPVFAVTAYIQSKFIIIHYSCWGNNLSRNSILKWYCKFQHIRNVLTTYKSDEKCSRTIDNI